MVKPLNIVNAHIDPTDGSVYADEGLASLTLVGQLITSGTFIDGALSHDSLVELDEDDHLQYALVDGTRSFTDNISTTASAPTLASHLTRKDYVDSVGGGGGGGGGVTSAAMTGVDGVTVISGTPTISQTTISGFRGEFIAASGSLQGQLDNFVVAVDAPAIIGATGNK